MYNFTACRRKIPLSFWYYVLQRFPNAFSLTTITKLLSAFSVLLVACTDLLSSFTPLLATRAAAVISTAFTVLFTTRANAIILMPQELLFTPMLLMLV